MNIAEFVGVLGQIAVMEAADRRALEKAAVIVETESKRVLGTYDYSWPPLQPETVASKATGDSPLLETGELRDSIHHEVHGHEADVGSDNDKAVWHELGTSRVPPRSFLMQAAVHKEHEVVKVLEAEVVLHLELMALRYARLP
jgi:phage gpG-like protein